MGRVACDGLECSPARLADVLEVVRVPRGPERLADSLDSCAAPPALLLPANGSSVVVGINPNGLSHRNRMSMVTQPLMR